jgi:hypothetical protein
MVSTTAGHANSGTGRGASGGNLRLIPIDWQSPKIAPGETDLGYFISQSLSREQRREWQVELIMLYYRELNIAREAAGSVDMSVDMSVELYPVEVMLSNFQIGAWSATSNVACKHTRTTHHAHTFVPFALFTLAFRRGGIRRQDVYPFDSRSSPSILREPPY